MMDSRVEGRPKLGSKLLDLLPRLVLGPSQLTNMKLALEVRRRCNLFREGKWKQLWEEKPPHIPRATREAAREEQEATRGYIINHNIDFACTAVTNGRPSQGMGMLMSNAQARDIERAWGSLQSVHYAPPADEPQLTADQQATYDQLVARPMRPEFKEAVATHLRELLPTLPRGVGAGPSGMRYEHLKAACGGVDGMEAVVEVCLKLAQGMWSDKMSAARLNALLKGADESDGYRPVACGEVLRRVVGKSMLKAISATVEKEFLRAAGPTTPRRG